MERTVLSASGVRSNLVPTPKLLFVSYSLFFFPLHLDPPFRSAYSSGKFFAPAVFNLREREKLSKSENSLFPFLRAFFFELLSKPRCENSRFALANSARGLSSALSRFFLFLSVVSVFTVSVVEVNFVRYSDRYIR